mmetsp:Transcript_2116/g.5231  ORF Transcript_2116/g.5231 Transcript_2116/m.5231 type:complete len:112 (+) Transcript_2116:1009-1344(+)
MLIPDCDGCYWGAISLAFLGLGYAVYAAVMWAAIPYTVEAKTIGTAFGVATAVQNFGLAVGPLIVGGLIDGTSLQDGYFWVSPSTGFNVLHLHGGTGDYLSYLTRHSRQKQ